MTRKVKGLTAKVSGWLKASPLERRVRPEGQKGALVAFLVATNRTNELIELETKNDIVKIINSPALEINEFVEHAGANKSFNSDALTRAG